MKFEDIIKTAGNNKKYVLEHEDLHKIISKINSSNLPTLSQEYIRIVDRINRGQPVTLYELIILVTEYNIGDLILDSDYTEVTCVDFITALKQGGKYFIDHVFLEERREEGVWGIFENKYIEQCVIDVANNKLLSIEDLLQGVLWFLDDEELLRQVLLEADFIRLKK